MGKMGKMKILIKNFKKMEVCSICFESLEDDKIHTTKCSHSYHKECLEKWLNKNNTCPICRTKIGNKRNRETYTNQNTTGGYIQYYIYTYPTSRIERRVSNETHVINRERYNNEIIMGTFFPSYTHNFTTEIERQVSNETHVINRESVEIERDLQTRINEQDIDIIISQTGCTREEAITSLVNNDYDIVNAIMEITL
jgi:NACalpha-BTF3-like transcription factor